MDREVTLLGEMDKVKAESSKYFRACGLSHSLVFMQQQQPGAVIFFLHMISLNVT